VAALTNEEPIEFITVEFDKEEFKHERRKSLLESKVKMRVKLSAFKLSDLVTARLVALAGSRYDSEVLIFEETMKIHMREIYSIANVQCLLLQTGILTLVGDKYNNRHHNWMYTKLLFQELLQQVFC